MAGALRLCAWTCCVSVRHLASPRYARIINAVHFTASNDVSFVYDGRSGAFEKRATTKKIAGAAPDPTGRRKKDRVPDTYELVASSEMMFQHVLVTGSVIVQTIWCLALYKFVTVVIPAIVYRGRYESIMDVIFHSDYLLTAASCLPAASLTLFSLRFLLSRFVMRIYLDREKEDYCAVYVGWIRTYPHYFTHKDVRVNPKSAAAVWHPNFFFKGKPAVIDIKDFRNVRDYHQMLRYAKKLKI